MKEIKRRKEVIAYILLIVTGLIWGGTWPIGRWIVSPQFGPTIPPLMIATIRYFLAVICFFPILKLQEGKINWQFARKNWKLLILMGLTSVTIYQIGYLFGEIFTIASDASIVVATHAIWVVILSSVFLKTEYFSWKKLIGTLLAFLAVIMVVGFSPNIEPNRIFGDVLILIAAFSYATYTVTSRYFLNRTQNAPESFQPSSLWILTWVSFFGLLITAPITLFINPEFLNPIEYLTIHPRIWIGIIYLAFFSTIGAYTFYLEGVKRLNASRAAIFQTLVPLFGVVFSAIFLQEPFDVFIYPFALFLVILGITLVNTSRKENQSSDKGEKNTPHAEKEH